MLKQKVVKVEQHRYVKGDWEEMKTLDKRLVLDRTSMRLITYGDISEYRVNDGFVLSPSVLPITHAYHCLPPNDSELNKLLKLDGSAIVDNPTSVDTRDNIWVKVQEKFRVRELSDWHDWTKLDQYHDLGHFKTFSENDRRLVFYDYQTLFKEYESTPEVQEILEVFGQTKFNMNDVDLDWYRYTSDGRIAIDEVCSKYAFARIRSKSPLLKDAPLMTVVPVKQLPQEDTTKELAIC